MSILLPYTISVPVIPSFVSGTGGARSVSRWLARRFFFSVGLRLPNRRTFRHTAWLLAVNHQLRRLA